MKIGAIIAFVLSAALAVVAINNVFFSGGANRPESADYMVGYAVGSFLLPMILLIVGLALLKKSNQA